MINFKNNSDSVNQEICSYFNLGDNKNADKMAAKIQWANQTARCVSNYTKPTNGGLFDQLEWIIYRIKESVKGIFSGSTDWQIATNAIIERKKAYTGFSAIFITNFVNTKYENDENFAELFLHKMIEMNKAY